MTTTYFKNKILQDTFKAGAGLYVGLSSTAPNANGGNATEPSRTGTGYARVALNSFSTPAGGATANAAALNFNESLTDWFPAAAPATHYVVFDAATNGNVLLSGALEASRNIQAQTAATYKANSLTFRLED
jgi:hypothetical protein